MEYERRNAIGILDGDQHLCLACARTRIGVRADGLLDAAGWDEVVADESEDDGPSVLPAIPAQFLAGLDMQKWVDGVWHQPCAVCGTVLMDQRCDSRDCSIRGEHRLQAHMPR